MKDRTDYVIAGYDAFIAGEVTCPYKPSPWDFFKRWHNTYQFKKLWWDCGWRIAALGQGKFKEELLK